MADVELSDELGGLGAEIKQAYEGENDTNAFTDNEKSKLSGIESGAQVNVVDSVNGQTGAVTLSPDDLDDAASTHKFTSQAEIDKLAGIESGAQVNVVDSVNGQTGSVTLSPDDLDDSASTHKFTSQADIDKLAGIASGAEVNTVDSDPSGVAGADQITNIISLTQAEYDAITPDAATLYVIAG